MRSSTLLLWAALAGACSGTILEPGGSFDAFEDPAERSGSDGRTPPAAVVDILDMCDPDDRGRSETFMRRLTSNEIRLALEDVFGDVVDAPAVRAAMIALPSEGLVTAGTPFDNRIHEVEALEALASAIADAMIVDTGPIPLLDCEASSIEACQSNLIGRLARRLFRRPLSSAEAQSYQAFMDDIGGIEGTRWAVVRAIVSPHFHQRLELQGESIGSRVRVDDFAVASRLALALTGSIPDEPLLIAAEERALTDVDSLRPHAQRLMQTDKAKSWIRAALRSWVGASAPDPSPIAAAAVGIEEGGFGAEAREELNRYIDHLVFEEHASLAQLLGDNRGFPFTERLAAVLGTTRSDAPVELTNKPRGLFLRPASLLTRQTRTNPIVRGATLRRRILCEEFPTPDPEIVEAGLAVIESLDPAEHTSRERAEAATAGGGCVGCHAPINAVGFALEELGPVGEWRERERVYDEEGSLIAEHPVNASTRRLGLTDADAVSGSVELIEVIAQSEEARHCFAQHLFMAQRYRLPAIEDSCLVTELVSALEEGASIPDAVIAAVANEDIFYRAEPRP